LKVTRHGFHRPGGEPSRESRAFGSVAVSTVGFRNSGQTTVVVWEITVRHLIYPLLLGAWLLGATAPADAASVCVDTVSELLSAINDYDDQTGPSTYTIKVVRGTYAVGAGLISTVHDAGFEEVTFQLLGGYSANCTSRTINPANTVIDAAGQANTGLMLQPAFNADVLIEGVTFTRFNSGSALFVQFLTRR
jgi:hypothetical protein